MKIIKRVFVTILLLLLTIDWNIYSIKAETNENIDKPFKVSARNAIAIDATNNQVLWNQNGYEIVPMASTTKILTALIAINYGDLEEEVTISKNASSIRGSTVGYREGEKITIKELLFGLMFRSGNDAAIAISEYIGGSVEGFSNIMNDYAKSLGIIDSHFESPHGLDSQKHYSTAYDLGILTAKAMENEIFRECVGKKNIYKNDYNFTRDYQNINKILYRIPDANGVKTGYTGGAGKCLVSSINYKDRNIIIVVLNCSDRWNVTEKIYNYVIENNNFTTKSKKEIIGEEKIAGLGEIISDEDITYGFKASDKVEVEVFSPKLDIEVGDIIGKISLKEKIYEKSKFPLISNIDISKEKLEKIILGEE